MGNASTECVNYLLEGCGLMLLALFLIVYAIVLVTKVWGFNVFFLMLLTCLTLLSAWCSPAVRKAFISLFAVAALAAIAAAPVAYTYALSGAEGRHSGEAHTQGDIWAFVLGATWAVIVPVSLHASARLNPGRQAMLNAAKKALHQGSSYQSMTRNMRIAAIFNVLLFVIAPAVLLVWLGAIANWQHRVAAITGSEVFTSSLARCPAILFYVLAFVYCAMAGLYARTHTRGNLAIMSYDVGRDALEHDASQIDNTVQTSLMFGDIRLISTAWLQSYELPTLPQHNGLPAAAFLSNAQAVEAHREGRVLVLSYRWHTASHPDPTGTTLELVRRFLRTLSHEHGLFWDWACLPQRPRTESEEAVFRRGLNCMGNLYGSLMKTTVIRCKYVPPRPSSHDKPVDEWSAWNDKPYDASGWCNFETGAAMLAAGHRHKRLERSLLRGLAKELPAKLIDISEGAPSGVQVMWPPKLSGLEAAIAAASFTGAADREKVVQMLREFNTLLEMVKVDTDDTRRDVVNKNWKEIEIKIHPRSGGSERWQEASNSGGTFADAATLPAAAAPASVPEPLPAPAAATLARLPNEARRH